MPETPRVPPDPQALDVYAMLEQATGDILQELHKAQAGRRLRPKLASLNRALYDALAQRSLFADVCV